MTTVQGVMSFHPRSIPAPLPHSVNVTVPPRHVMGILAEELVQAGKKQIIIENMRSAWRLSALQRVAAASPDGHTLISASASSFTSK